MEVVQEHVALVGRVIRTVYRATIVQIANRSRRRRGLPELDRYGRRCLIASTVVMGAFLALCVSVALQMEPHPRTAPTSSRPSSTQTYAPPAVPVSYAPPTPSFEPAPPADMDVDYVPLPDDDHDFDKPRICHRKWWC